MVSGANNIQKEEIFSFTLTTDLSELDRLHAMLENFTHAHHLDKRTVFETSLALEELFTNIVAYGRHRDNTRQEVHFFLSYGNNCISVRIEDDAAAFNLLDAQEAELHGDLERRPVGGLGIHLIRTLMDEVAYERVGGKNVVTLRKKTIR